MKKIIIPVVIFLFLAGAACSGAVDLGSWLKDATRKLGAVKKEKPKRPSGLAGVKGEGEDDSASAVYWKEERAADGEAALFEEAVTLVENGDTEGAAAKLREFVEKYPGSPLVKEAREGLALIEDAPER